jgi:hypothetical protein
MSDFKNAVKSVVDQSGLQNVQMGIIKGTTDNFAWVDTDGQGSGKKCKIASGLEVVAGDYGIIVTLDRSPAPVLFATFSANNASKQKKVDSDAFSPPFSITSFSGPELVVWTWSAPITDKNLIYWIQISPSGLDDDGLAETVGLSKGTIHVEMLSGGELRYLRIKSIMPDGQQSGWSSWVSGVANALPGQEEFTEARWSVPAGTDILELPDMASDIDYLMVNGFMVDPMLYELSEDGSEISLVNPTVGIVAYVARYSLQVIE